MTYHIWVLFLFLFEFIVTFSFYLTFLKEYKVLEKLKLISDYYYENMFLVILRNIALAAK